jgi:hypothetical protein
MRVVLVNYATPGFAPYQAINCLTGLRCGFDRFVRYGPENIDADFSRRNAATLGIARGAGCWLWKPYCVARALAELAPGDLLFYADAAMHFVNPIDPILELQSRHDLDLLILGEGFVEARYTKRDAFVLMEADRTRWAGSAQRFASAFMLRKSAWTDGFVARYLGYAEDARILTDSPNACGLPNYPGFVAHRHDQSIFSLLSKREQVPVVASGLIAEGLPQGGGHIIHHTRSRHSPRKIIKQLLIEGVISVESLNSIAEFPRVRPKIPV